MRSLASLILGVLSLSAPSLMTTPARAGEGEVRARLTHRGQVGIHAQLGTGYRMLVPYDHEFCGEAGESVCVGRSPFFLELGLSYGVSRSVELLADVRLGLEEDFQASNTDGPRPLALAPGLKFFVDDEGALKFFSTLQVALDFTDYSASLGEDQLDFGVRNVNGLQFDLARYVGIYVHVGMTIGMRRWFRWEPDGGLGIQARFP